MLPPQVVYLSPPCAFLFTAEYAADSEQAGWEHAIGRNGFKLSVSSSQLLCHSLSICPKTDAPCECVGVTTVCVPLSVSQCFC